MGGEGGAVVGYGLGEEGFEVAGRGAGGADEGFEEGDVDGGVGARCGAEESRCVVCYECEVFGLEGSAVSVCI